MTPRPIPHSRPWHDVMDETAVLEVLRSQMTAEGAVSGRLADKAKSFFAGRYAAATAGGTLALVEALRALEVGAGQDVVLPTYVCPEVMDAVLYVGATPVLCDVDEVTYAPSAATVSAALTARTRAVVVPHLFGIPADVDGILELGVPVVEDLAQGLGAHVGGRPVGSRGSATVLSFKAIKVVSCGEGGAVVVRDAAAAERLWTVHERRIPKEPSYRFPLADLNAAVALSQWSRLGEFIARRRALARRYLELLTGEEKTGLRLPADFEGRSWFRFPVGLPKGVDPLVVRREMDQEGIQVRRPVDGLLHRGPDLPPEGFPVSERIFARTISLPLYPALTEEDQDHVAAAFKRTLARLLG